MQTHCNTELALDFVFRYICKTWMKSSLFPVLVSGLTAQSIGVSWEQYLLYFGKKNESAAANILEQKVLLCRVKWPMEIILLMRYN